VRGLSQPTVQAERDTSSAAGALGQIFFQRAILRWLAAGAFKPGQIVGVLHALQEFFIILDGDDYGDGFALACYDFGFWHGPFHVANIHKRNELSKREDKEKGGQ